MTNRKQEDRRYLSLAEFSRKAGISRPTVYAYLDEGILVSEKFKRIRLIDDRFVNLIKNKNYKASIALANKIKDENALNEKQFRIEM